ncbi:MAG TPA: hypothetical protein VFL29_01280 [Candidatus Dormibacteraeota bacterium]|nr:hypothetical protein [Candidatus Dormibacteraeota bacterium]
MLRKLDRIAIALVSLLVGLQALIPGWTIMADGSVYGFKLPTSWLTSYWPFSDFFVAGLLLLVVVGGGCLATAAMVAASGRFYAIAGLVMGVVLVGWIAGELVFMSQTMVMTWIILGSGLALIALSAPYAVSEARALRFA